MLLFEFAARHIDIVSRYVIGVAAGLSDNLTYAEELLLDSRTKLEALVAGGDAPALAPLRSRISTRLGEVYDILLAQTRRRFGSRRPIRKPSQSCGAMASGN